MHSKSIKQQNRQQKKCPGHISHVLLVFQSLPAWASCLLPTEAPWWPVPWCSGCCWARPRATWLPGSTNVSISPPLPQELRVCVCSLGEKTPCSWFPCNVGHSFTVFRFICSAIFFKLGFWARVIAQRERYFPCTQLPVGLILFDLGIL